MRAYLINHWKVVNYAGTVTGTFVLANIWFSRGHGLNFFGFQIFNLGVEFMWGPALARIVRVIP